MREIRSNLKSGLQECDVPPISVIEHPKEQLCTIELDRSASSETFTIGCFGWIGTYKRIHSIIEAYAKLRSSWLEFRQRSRVVIAGQLPDPRHFDPRALAYQLGVDDKIEFTGFLNHEEFLRKLGEVNLQFNLRYPSCGETSGTLHVGRSLLRNTVLTSYQSFREEAASYHVSADPDFEVAEIASIMRNTFDNWLSPGAQDKSGKGGAEKAQPKSEALRTVISRGRKVGLKKSLLRRTGVGRKWLELREELKATAAFRDHVETKIDHVETKIDKVEPKFDQVETKIDQVETKLEKKIDISTQALEMRIDNIYKSLLRQEKIAIEVKLDPS